MGFIMINMTCEKCGAILEIPDKMIGQDANCPKCNAPLKIPTSNQHDQQSLTNEILQESNPIPETKNKKAEKKQTSIVRSSAAEYLIFVAASGQGGVEAIYANENIWLTQKMMGVLYDIKTHTINYHLKKVFSDSELEVNSVIRNFRITATV